MGQAVSAASSSLRGSQPPPVPQASTTTVKDHAGELVRLFNSFDANRDGRISASEIQELFGCTDTDAKEMVDAVDTDGDGLISIEEFRVLMEDGESDALRRAFAVYDENGDGMITAEELCTALRRVLRMKDLTVELCSKIIATVDKDGDGLISFDEFKAMMATWSP